MPENGAVQPRHKRKRSSPELNPSGNAFGVGAAAANADSHQHINYLSRQHHDDMPLVSSNDSLPSVLALLNDYDAVLDRHESMASNLGARPLGPMLLSRFERLFDGQPWVLQRENGARASVSWLDVVEFARSRPEQFALNATSVHGGRACQFNDRGCIVQISEEDHVLISSGMPQKMIPPQPIAEDEERELGTLEIVENNVSRICQLADQIAVRARQYNNKLQARKQAIIDRRAADTAISGAAAMRASSPSNVALMSGLQAAAQSPGSGTAVIPRTSHEDINGSNASDSGAASPVSGGQSFNPATAAPAVRGELLKHFAAAANRRTHISTSGTASPSLVNVPHRSPHMYQNQQEALLPDHTAYSVPSQNGMVPSTPALIYQTSRSATNEEGGPFKANMVARLETLNKGDQVYPPCDRCRRLHMDCVKNLTACIGCTKKHAKCSWKEVREDEVRSIGGPFMFGPSVTPPVINGPKRIPDGIADITMTDRDRGPSQSPRMTSKAHWLSMHKRQQSHPLAQTQTQAQSHPRAIVRSQPAPKIAPTMPPHKQPGRQGTPSSATDDRPAAQPRALSHAGSKVRGSQSTQGSHSSRHNSGSDNTARATTDDSDRGRDAGTEQGAMSDQRLKSSPFGVLHGDGRAQASVVRDVV